MTTTNKSMYYSIAKQYTKLPGTRNRGPHSGEHFRENVLKNLVTKAINEESKLVIDLAGTHGFAPSFLEESFGGLIREGYFTKDQLLTVLEVKCDEMPLYAEKVIEFVKSAAKK